MTCELDAHYKMVVSHIIKCKVIQKNNFQLSLNDSNLWNFGSVYNVHYQVKKAVKYGSIFEKLVTTNITQEQLFFFYIITIYS